MGAEKMAQNSPGAVCHGNNECREGLPSWLLADEKYEPPRDRDGFIRKSMLSLLGVLRRMRLDDGQATRLSPSAPTKLVVGLALILLTSLSRNYAFVLVMLAVTLAREAFLPTKALRRCAGVSFAAAGITALVMLPAVLLGQGHSALFIGTKVLVTVGVAMVVALSTPVAELTGALRAVRVPNEFIMTVDLALKGIVDLGQVAFEVLQALNLRSVGLNRRKSSSLGGVAGVTFLKAEEAAHATSDAMRCRGFEGEYVAAPRAVRRGVDVAWWIALAMFVLLFAYLEIVL